MGFLPNLSASIWMGEDDRRPTHESTTARKVIMADDLESTSRILHIGPPGMGIWEGSVVSQ